MRKLSNANTFVTAAEGASGLMGRLPALREQMTELRKQQTDLNPDSVSDVAALHARYYANYGIHGESRLETDRNQNAMEQKRVAQQQADITGKVTESLREQLRMSDERLSFDKRTAEISELRLQRERELNELKASGGQATAENVALVNTRYDDQVKSLEQARVADEDRFRVQQATSKLQLSSLGTEQQLVAAAEKRSAEAGKELKSRIFNNAEERRSLILQQQGDDNTVRLAQRAELAKGPRGIQRDLLAQHRRETANVKLDRRINATNGLIGAHRNMAGDIIGGLDPVTGEYRTAAPGTGLAEHGLHTGTLDDRPTGGAFDTDPNGGLHGGETPRFFEHTTAHDYLAGKQSVGDLLAAHTGDPAHDPAARLAQASIFSDLKQKMQEDMKGRGYMLRPEPFSAGFMIHSPNQPALDREGEIFSKRRDRGTLAGARTALHTSALTLQTGVHFKDPHTGAAAVLQIQTRSLETQVGMSVKLDKLITLFGNLPDTLTFQ